MNILPVNQNFRNGDLPEIERHLLEVCQSCSLGDRFKKHLNCVLPDYKMKGLIKAKSRETAVSYMSCLL